jgi:hypothetical protein
MASDVPIKIGEVLRLYAPDSLSLNLLDGTVCGRHDADGSLYDIREAFGNVREVTNVNLGDGIVVNHAVDFDIHQGER